MSSSTKTPKYNRRDFKHWSDLDGDGIDTRQYILARDSLIPVEWAGNRVVSGLWTDPYTGRIMRTPKECDIEHGVALKDAHLAGAWKLSPEDKELLANDERHLYVTWSGSNRSKGARNLLEYLPADLSFLGRYADMRRVIYAEYDLYPTECETLALEFFDGYGKYFEKGIKVLDVRDWVIQNKEIFNHPCFQYKAN